MKRRERWFVEGAAALRRTMTVIGRPDALPPTGEFYACPCCLRAYGRDALDARVLTEEHVPPDKVGGRKLVLTCKACNNIAGTRLDRPAADRETLHDFLAARAPDRALDLEFTVGDIATIHGDIRHADDALLLFVVPKNNHPKHLEELTRTLNAWAAGEVANARGRYRLTKRVSVTRARLSWVRAAYLAAFAALGWQYVFQPCLDPLRAQLADPEASLLPPLALRDPGASPERRQLLIVQEPPELRSLAVVLGRYTVFLPSPADPQPFEALSTALAQFPVVPTSPPQLARKKISWAGKQVPWPDEPLYILDRQPPAARGWPD
jgi:hypothetical protein